MVDDRTALTITYKACVACTNIFARAGLGALSINVATTIILEAIVKLKTFTETVLNETFVTKARGLARRNVVTLR